MTTNYEELGNILQSCKAIKFGEFTLASGKKSRYYVDVKKAITKPKILELICEHIVDIIRDLHINVDYVACVELGAVPIGVEVSIKTGLDLIIIRKERKDHGIQSKIVGDFEKTKTALLVEDVTTTGGSVILAVQTLRDAGIVVTKVISVVDRDEGAEEALDKEGLKLYTLVRAKTLLEDYEVAEALRHSGGIKTDDMMLMDK